MKFWRGYGKKKSTTRKVVGVNESRFFMANLTSPFHSTTQFSISCNKSECENTMRMIRSKKKGKKKKKKKNEMIFSPN